VNSWLPGSRDLVFTTSRVQWNAACISTHTRWCSCYGGGRATRWSQVRFPATAAAHWMGDKQPQHLTEPTRPTQPPTLSGTGNQYRSKWCDALRLGSKGRYGSFHLWINVWVAGRTVWTLVNTCQPERFRDEYHIHYKALYIMLCTAVLRPCKDRQDLRIVVLITQVV